MRKNAEEKISIRLTAEENQKLKRDSNAASMNVSGYVRCLIRNHVPKADNNHQQIATLLCRLYIKLKENGMNADEEIMEEMDELCRKLY